MTIELDPGSLEALLPIANRLLKMNAQSWDELVDALLPPDIALAKKLAVFYEAEMLRCRDAGAFYAGCVMGAAMIESLLLLLCLQKASDVSATKSFMRRCGTAGKDFSRQLHSLGFDDLISISAELNWIPSDLVSEEWKQGLGDTFKEVVIERGTHMSKAEREERAAALRDMPAYSLMLLLNHLRNRIHGGRWLKERQQFTSEAAFQGWAQAAIVGAAHIRDCILAEHMRTFASGLQAEMIRKMRE